MRDTTTPFWKILYFQALFAIVAGALLGHFAPRLVATKRPLGDGFVVLIRMVIAPIILRTVVACVVVVSAWGRELDRARLAEALRSDTPGDTPGETEAAEPVA